MRVSRWGRSSYESDAILTAEACLLDAIPSVTVLPMMRDAEVITVNSGTRVDAELLQRVPSARLVLTTTSGFDHLNLPEIVSRGLSAGRCPLARRDAVVDSSLALLLDGLRAHGPLTASTREGHWARSQLPQLGMRTLRGAAVGIVGLGVIGQRMCTVLQALGARVSACDPLVAPPAGVSHLSLHQMVERCDAISLHCRLEPQSQHLVDGALLAKASGLVLINTARGSIVDVPAAVEAVQRKRLAFLGLDVFPTEPWPSLSECRHPRVVYLPHAAGFHRDLGDAVAQELVAAVTAFTHGAPLPHPVC